MKTVGTNDEVGTAWLMGFPMRSHNGHFRTDGKDLWSYALQIGKRDDQNRPLLLAVQSLISVTTSAHIRAAWGATIDGKYVEPTLVKPIITNQSNWSAYTRYSFPENNEPQLERWGISAEIIRYTPNRLRTAFDDNYVEINDLGYFKKLKLPDGTLSAYIRDFDDDAFSERRDLDKYDSFWISSDCWNYVPGKREERVYLRELADDEDSKLCWQSDYGDRTIFVYYLTRAAESPRSYLARTDVFAIHGNKRIEHVSEEFLPPGRTSRYGKTARLVPYKGGVSDPMEFKTLLHIIADENLEASVRVVERDNDSYRKTRERLAQKE